MVVPLVALAGLAVAAPVAVSSAKTAASAASHPNLGPQVVHTGTAPTGYEVTFRYYDPSATRVQIKGEWYFANPYQLDRLSGSSSTDIVQSPGILPTQWQPGDVPLAHPNSTAANWPVVDLTQIGHSGVW